MIITSYSKGDFTILLNVSYGLLIRASREMSEILIAKGVFVAQIFNKDETMAKVCGVQTEHQRGKLVDFIKDLKGLKFYDWYELHETMDVHDVVRFAKEEDHDAFIYDVVG